MDRSDNNDLVGQGRSPNPSVVPQIPAEYDDLYMQRGSYATQRDFSQDINKRMKMPNRLSVDGKNLHDLEVENMRVRSSPHMTAAGMAVPDKITLTGAGQRDVTEDQYGYYNGSMPAENTGYVNITTPPRVLTVDERFPLVHDEPPQSDTSFAELHSARDLETTPYKQRPTSLITLQESRDISTIESRLDQLERSEASRQKRDMIVYPAIAVYCLYKLVSWVRS